MPSSNPLSSNPLKNNPLKTPILVFDIETVPDVDTGKRLYHDLNQLSDADALTALIALRQQQAGTDFMRLPLHKVACLSFLWVSDGQLTLKSLSLDTMTEEQILSTFFRAFDQQPNLVSWNGSGFDIPVLLYRAMHHKLSAPALLNEHSGEFKYNNYLNRYHSRHLDLMDKLTLYAGFNKQPLDVVAALCGFAGKQDTDGSMVLGLVQDNQWQQLTTYCESDVLNTWLIYLRWQRLSGNLSHTAADELELTTRQFVQQLVGEDGSCRHQGFLQGWVD